jgi:hypothetical protein
MNRNRFVLWSLSSMVIACGTLALPAAAQGSGDYQRFEEFSQSTSDVSRAEVRGLSAAAVAAGEVRLRDYHPSSRWTELSAPALSRAQVAAEAREATKLGLVPHGELDVTPMPRPQQPPRLALRAA